MAGPSENWRDAFRHAYTRTEAHDFNEQERAIEVITERTEWLIERLSMMSQSDAVDNQDKLAKLMNEHELDDALACLDNIRQHHALRSRELSMQTQWAVFHTRMYSPLAVLALYELQLHRSRHELANNLRSIADPPPASAPPADP